jgi:glycosyltransferase involved in cell wall biosynthesis
MGVVFDLQAVQSRDYGERGIARYVRELSTALEARHPELIGAYALNPDLPIPASVEPLGPRARLVDDVDRDAATVWHSASPFEVVTIDRLWPRWTRRLGVRLAVSLHDVIPALFPEEYFGDEGVRRRYLARIEFIRRADVIFTLSECTANDAVANFGLRPERIHIVGAGRTAQFRPPASRAEAYAQATTLFPALRPAFVLYVGGVDHRKNLDGLIDAWSRLSAEARSGRILAVVCALSPADAARCHELVARFGVEKDVVFLGRVLDDDLVTLYQATDLFVFPSLYEGFGLPVVEARACGAPVIASKTSSLPELLSAEEACFDPADPADIASALERTLATPGQLDRLRSLPVHDSTWDDVADRVAEGYASLAGRGRRRTRLRRRVAYVSPVPPAPSGVAVYGSRLLEELRHHCDVDVFYDGPADLDLLPAGVHGHHIGTYDGVESIRGGFDRVIYVLGNQTLHVSALKLMRSRPGAVIAHDLRLTGLYAWCAEHATEVVPQGFANALHEMYEGRLPAQLGAAGFLDYREADAFGVFMARDVINMSTAFLVHSPTAARWARLDARAGDRHKVGALPFAIPARHRRDRVATDRPLIVSFGVVDPIKRSPALLEMFADVVGAVPGARLALVGPLPDVVRDEYLDRARRLGIGHAVTVTGRVDDAAWDAWLDEADVAVQLRASSNGEWSGAVADCLSVGLPTVVSDIGYARDLPSDAAVRVATDIGPADLATEVVALVGDAARLARLRAGAIAYADAHTFSYVAETIYRSLVLNEPVLDSLSA